jgi:hypothetical protein
MPTQQAGSGKGRIIWTLLIHGDDLSHWCTLRSAAAPRAGGRVITPEERKLLERGHEVLTLMDLNGVQFEGPDVTAGAEAFDAHLADLRAKQLLQPGPSMLSHVAPWSEQVYVQIQADETDELKLHVELFDPDSGIPSEPVDSVILEFSTRPSHEQLRDMVRGWVDNRPEPTEPALLIGLPPARALCGRRQPVSDPAGAGLA